MEMQAVAMAVFTYIQIKISQFMGQIIHRWIKHYMQISEEEGLTFCEAYEFQRDFFLLFPFTE